MISADEHKGWPDLRQEDRHAIQRVLDGGVVHLDAPHAHDPSRRLEPQQVAGGDRP